MSEAGAGPKARVLWLYGADAVGKSTIGWEAYMILADRDARVAYLDADYLGFCHPAPENPAVLVAENLRAVWSVYSARGVDHLVVSGIVVTAQDRETLQGAMPEARFTFCRLTASPDSTRRRIVARREAEARTQNATLSTETRAELEAYGQRSVEFADLLSSLALEDFVLSTDGSTPRELATEAVGRFLAISG